MKKWVTLAVMAAALVSCTEASGPVQEPSLAAPRLAVQTGIPGAYVVTLRDGDANVDQVATSLASQHGGLIAHLYKYSLRGFAIRNLSEAAAARIAQDPRVASVTPDQMAYAVTTQTPTPSWGLDRTDQQNLPLDNSYTYTPDGTGVHVYSIDTGVEYTHPDFGGRAVFGADFVSSDNNDNGIDCNGHGTHTSGTAGGTTYGIAKNVTIHGVRVLSCSGSAPYSDVIAGVDWVTANFISPAVANMSLGGPVFQPLDDAVTASIAAGVTYTVSAGNSNADACTQSPADTPNAITVGATASNDAFAVFSNGGPCVDINAPGVGITSDWLFGGVNTLDGTSMSSPHVAGAAALYLTVHPTETPAQVAAALIANATPNKITNINPNTPNLLLYTGFLNGGGSPSVASFTYSCSGLTCTFDGTGSTNATSWGWTFGDGGTGSGSVVQHTYAAARAKPVVTLNTTPAGPSSSTSKTLRCRTTPTAGCK